jgi:hypothetical protein
MCEASIDRKMDDEFNHQNITSPMTDEVISLRASASVDESGDGARLLATIDVSDDGNYMSSKVPTDDPCSCSDTASSSRSGDDHLVPGRPTKTLPLKKTTLTNISREEDSGSIIASDADGSKCNSTAPLIGSYAASSATSSFDKRNNDGELQEELNDIDSLLIPPPPYKVKSTTVMETEDKLLTTINTGPSSEEEKDAEPNIALQHSPRPTVATYMKGKVLEDNGKLNERLKKRWEKRNQERRATTTNYNHQDVVTLSRNNYSSPSPRHRLQSSSSNKSDSTIVSDNSDILSKYSGGMGSTTPQILYPDTVSFGEEDPEEGGVPRGNKRTTAMPTYRKCYSEIGPNTCSSSPRRIGILQADGIVYDDALLLRLARQSHPTGQHRRCGSATIKGDSVDPLTGEEFPVFQTNEVKIHVYDLLTQDTLVEMPYLNCNFPIGRCFKAVNDGCNYFGTGAYHVGVEVNGVEYAYGGNNIQGMSGIFTCVPKEPPGYDYRDTIDLGKLRTVKRTWIRIPKARPMNQGISAALVKLTEEIDDTAYDEKNDASEGSQHAYSFREIETFADGHMVILEMARDYMGVDYDLLHKNCCTFARDACLRLGVNEEDIPSWFRNAAQAVAQAEDTMNDVDNTVKNVFNCTEEMVRLEDEEFNAGFEVIAKIGGRHGGNTLISLQVVESPPEHRSRSTFLGIPIGQSQELAARETASWA